MNEEQAYAMGFRDSALRQGCLPENIVKTAQALGIVRAPMTKRAGKFGMLSRLMARLSPKVKPGQLDWLSRLFTDTKVKSTFLRGGSREELAKALRKSYKAKGMPVPGELADAASGSVSGSPMTKNLLDELSGSPYKDVVTTRLNPLKVLAGTGLLGGAAGATDYAVEKHLENKRRKALQKKMLMGAAGGAGLLALLGGGKALLA